MDEALLAAYRATAYRVRLARGGWAAIHVDEPPPAALLALIGERPWGFVTAWNPYSQPAPRADNRRAQRGLLAALRAMPETAAVFPACGVGPGGWREPSLFVLGPGTTALDTLAHRYEQNAYVHGYSAAPAQLRLLR
jgi:hypothetical protein